MLIQFRVSNYLTIRDEATLSMVASNDKTCLATHTAPVDVPGCKRLLRSAAILGPNGSGKSTLIKAFQFMARLVQHSDTEFGFNRPFPSVHFKLDQVSHDRPTLFEVDAIIEGTRYQYRVEIMHGLTTYEALYAFINAKPQCWFEREFSQEDRTYSYVFSPNLKGDKKVWQNATHDSVLFLTQAVKLNAAQLAPIYWWFVSSLAVINESSTITMAMTKHMIKQGGEKRRQQIVRFMRSADIGITDINLKANDALIEKLHYSKSKVLGLLLGVDASVRKEDGTELDGFNELVDLALTHSTPHGQAVFGVEDESSGTRALLALIGHLVNALELGRTIIIDELDSSLHPLIVRMVVGMFNSTDNTTGAQLIFSTHDATVLDAPGLLRRDQVWFTEKGKAQATTLIPLLDFKPRLGEAIGRGYLSGRYGGIPFVDDSGIQLPHEGQ